jgi:hypothetical protein
MVKRFGSALATLALVLLVVPSAMANCITGGGKEAARPGFKALIERALAKNGNGDSPVIDGGSIVGLWDVTFFVGNGPDVYDRGFEQWHEDGTEITMDIAVSPAAGNVCLGVWKQTGPRTVKLHHVGWNWDISVTPAAFAGLFVLDMTVTLGKTGDVYVGNYVTDSYDTNGNQIPAFHGDGVVRGSRISVQ